MAFWSTRVKDHTKHDDMTDEKNLKTGTGPDIDFCLSFSFYGVPLHGTTDSYQKLMSGVQ